MKRFLFGTLLDEQNSRRNTLSYRPTRRSSTKIIFFLDEFQAFNAESMNYQEILPGPKSLDFFSISPKMVNI